MTPLRASWLVKACGVLHNRCIDWGLRNMRRGQNRDPEHKMNIQVWALMQFNRYNQEIREDKLPSERQSYGSTHKGIVRPAQYVFKNYGGPVPSGGVHRRQREGCRRGHGHGCDSPGDERVGGPIHSGRFNDVEVDVDVGQLEGNLVQIKLTDLEIVQFETN